MTANEPLGSAADEAARLLDSLRRWVDDRVPPGDPVASSGECRFCPLCRATAALREGQPEALEHLSRALDSLLAAARAGMTSHEHRWARPPAADAQHIDVT